MSKINIPAESNPSGTLKAEPLQGLSSWLRHMAYKFLEDGPTLIDWAKEVAAVAASTPPVDAVLGEPVAPSEPMYLVMAGGDGFTSRIVPASKLDDAYLLTQWFDLESIDPESRANALAHFHDDDEWTHTDVSGGGERLQFNLNLEDGWVNVIRLFDTTPLAAPVASRDVQAEPAMEIRDLLCELGNGVQASNWRLAERAFDMSAKFLVDQPLAATADPATHDDSDDIAAEKAAQGYPGAES